MTKVSNAILASAKKSQAIANIPVFVEKSAVSPDGARAKVLFRLGLSPERSRKTIKHLSQVVESFNNRMEGSARMVKSSIHKSDIQDMYCATVVLNRQMVSQEQANKDPKFKMVSANMFADDTDNIWNVEEVDGEKILVRTASEDLAGILKTRVSPPSMATAAAGYILEGNLVSGCYASVFDHNSETMRRGVAVDRNTLFDFTSKKFYEVAGCDVAAITETDSNIKSALDTLFDDPNISFRELSSVDGVAMRRSIKEYLTALYSQNKQFLDTYLDKVNSLLSV